MPRRARLRIAGLPLHVVQRGNDKKPCFFSDRDRVLYLGLLQELLARHRCRLHAYVLMTNHVHLLLTPEREESISNLMKNLGQRYVQYVNRTNARSGSLWEGRFRSSIVDSENYLFLCYRYVELNPVRAGMVRRPLDYAWSSHRTNAAGEPSPIVTPHPNFDALASCDASRRVAYSALFDKDPTEAELKLIRDSSNGGFALGNQAFRDCMTQRLGRRSGPGIPGRRPKEDALAAWFS
jgi:putative transposase